LTSAMANVIVPTVDKHVSVNDKNQNLEPEKLWSKSNKLSKVDITY
jgi:hypothetical protein